MTPKWFQDETATAAQLRGAETHERAAMLHKDAADYYERGAAADHAHGWHDLAELLEKHADGEREASALEQELADQIREQLSPCREPWCDVAWSAE